jgi:CubicO group peptidase (beta-lactamase class C family)
MRKPIAAVAAAFWLVLSDGADAADILPAANPAATVAAYFDALGARGAFNGVLLVARGDEIVFRKAYGFADFENRVPLRLDHIFRIGSLTKPVTASAVLAVVGKGELALDAPLCRFLERCPASWRPVTIAHLLSHRSGIRDRFGELQAVPVEQTVAELRRVLATIDPGEPLKAAPGSAYAYSNFNYVLLGAVLERVHRRPWRQIVRTTAAAPAGAITLDYDAVADIVDNRARGYARGTEGRVRNIVYKDHAAYAAGGLRSTIGDFFRWSRAALKARLFSASLRDRMVTAPAQGNYGFGWQVTNFLGRPVYNHTGGIDGFSTHIAHYPAEDVTVIVFTNIESDSAILMACDAAALHFAFHGAGVTPERVTVLPPAQRCGIDQRP